jgi:hypothetical protein
MGENHRKAKWLPIGLTNLCSVIANLLWCTQTFFEMVHTLLLGAFCLLIDTNLFYCVIHCISPQKLPTKANNQNIITIEAYKYEH